MPDTYEIEFAKPSLAHCRCCGGLSVRLTGFVSRNDDAFAVYYVQYSNEHPDDELSMLVSLGEWGEDGTAAQRVAFFCRVRPTGDAYEVMLDEAANSPWADVEVVGTMLSQRDARRHPWKAKAFEVLDEAFLVDPALAGFLKRAQCDDASAPLERSFAEPDVVFALRGSEKRRAKTGQSFATLDEKRFFVRCLLPLPVKHYEAWSVGIWVEVSRTDWKRIRAAWDDPEAYATLQFGGRVANDLVSDLGLAVPLGTAVQVRVEDAATAPLVKGPRRGALGRLLTRPWSRRAFEEFAVGRGYL